MVRGPTDRPNDVNRRGINESSTLHRGIEQVEFENLHSESRLLILGIFKDKIPHVTLFAISTFAFP